MNAITNTFKQLFSFDLRSIAFFRILYGFILLYDLADRARYITAHYSDLGLLPREAVLEHDWISYYFSIHMMSGEANFQLILFAINAIFAFFVLVGFRTKWALFICLIFIHSLHVRNSIITTGGDIVLRLMMFWAMFLPLSKVWSVDSYLDTNKPLNDTKNYSFTSMATVAFMVQMVSIYFFSIYCKTGDTWMNGQAVYYALMLDQYNHPISRWLAQFDWLTYGLTKFTLTLEHWGGLLFLIPFKWQWFRLIGVLLFMSLHIGFIFTLHLGFFPYICIFAWVALLPPMVWNFLFGKTFLCKVKNYIAKKSATAIDWLVSKKWLHKREITTFDWGITGSILVSIFMVLTVWWNMYSLKWVKMPNEVKKVVRYARLNQKWGMFSPNPSRSDGWFVIEGHFSDGINRNLITGEPITQQDFEKPYCIACAYDTHRWRKYYNNISRKKKSKYRRYLGRYLTTEWRKNLKEINEGKPRNEQLKLETFVIYYMKEINKLNLEETEPKKVTLWKHWTDKKYKNRFSKEEAKVKDNTKTDVSDKALERKKKYEEWQKKLEEFKRKSKEKLEKANTDDEDKVLIEAEIETLETEIKNEKQKNIEEEYPEEQDAVDSEDNIFDGEPEEKPKPENNDETPNLDGEDDE